MKAPSEQSRASKSTEYNSGSPQGNNPLELSVQQSPSWLADRTRSFAHSRVDANSIGDTSPTHRSGRHNSLSANTLANGGIASSGHPMPHSVSPSLVRKGGSNVLTLYVRTKEDDRLLESPANGRAREEDAAADEGDAAVEKGEHPTEDTKGPFEGVIVAAAQGAVGQLAESIPAARRLAKQPAVIAAAVFLYFLLVLICLLLSTRNTISSLLTLRTNWNGRLLVTSASLTEQLLEKAMKADEMMLPYKRVPPGDVDRLLNEIGGLRRVRDRSITLLYDNMSYLGPKDDLTFLVEEHVAYEQRIRRLCQEEVRWVKTLRKSRRHRLRELRASHVIIGDDADSGAMAAAARARAQVQRELHEYRRKERTTVLSKVNLQSFLTSDAHRLASPGGTEDELDFDVRVEATEGSAPLRKKSLESRSQGDSFIMSAEAELEDTATMLRRLLRKRKVLIILAGIFLYLFFQLH